jgi:hypothetical protein
MKSASILIIEFILGLGAGVYFTDKYFGNFILRNLYIDEAISINRYTTFLKAQHENNQEK